MDQGSGRIDQFSTAEAKIALFRSLFRGRDDVYPRPMLLDETCLFSGRRLRQEPLAGRFDGVHGDLPPDGSLGRAGAVTFWPRRAREAVLRRGQGSSDETIYYTNETSGRARILSRSDRVGRARMPDRHRGEDEIRAVRGLCREAPRQSGRLMKIQMLTRPRAIRSADATAQIPVEVQPPARASTCRAASWTRYSHTARCSISMVRVRRPMSKRSLRDEAHRCEGR